MVVEWSKINLMIHQHIVQEPLSWLVGSEVLVVDPPRKGLDASLLDALQTISSVEKKAKSSSER